ncbi:MAG: tRNA (N6-threonylcarbamoyladenosine(37)-N6)-methyltransferase TrmO [Clostridia bacterium]|nr:tRNA (N6-threonylcarbamoyladenosine(37)-N6)-methyltransferase TrmO [Clostridia bacterium]
MEIKPIAYIKNDFDTKFGVPRQSGLADTVSKIVFEKEYRDPNALRGIEEFSHLWLIWEFTEFSGKGWSPTVRPPRLGGNTRVGVFATRSPNRPNNLGLTLVKLISVDGCELTVSGADLINGTPIYDIKPYLPAFEAIPDAKGGFADDFKDFSLKIEYDENILNKLPEEKRASLVDILKGDPRPSYQDDPERVYGFGYAGYEIKFKVCGDTVCLVDIMRSAECGIKGRK